MGLYQQSERYNLLQNIWTTPSQCRSLVPKRQNTDPTTSPPQNTTSSPSYPSPSSSNSNDTPTSTSSSQPFFSPSPSSRLSTLPAQWLPSYLYWGSVWREKEWRTSDGGGRTKKITRSWPVYTPTSSKIRNGRTSKELTLYKSKRSKLYLRMCSSCLPRRHQESPTLKLLLWMARKTSNLNLPQLLFKTSSTTQKPSQNSTTLKAE